MPGPSTVGRNIARARKEKGWSQPKFAEISGVNIDTLRAIESGKNQEPRDFGPYVVWLGRSEQELRFGWDEVPEPTQRTPASDALPTAFLEFMRSATGRGLTGEQLDAIHSRATAKANTRGYALADFEQAYRDLYVVREDKRTESKAQATEVDAKKTEGLKKIERKKR